MVNVLIPTKPDDMHAILTNLALKEKGHSSLLWYTADFPSQQQHSFELENQQLKWSANGTDFEISNDQEFNVVWVRRPRKPVLPKYIHADDMNNAKSENTEFYKTFWQNIAPDAFWINPVNSLSPVNNKLKQLQTAIRVGLNVPETLMSNNPKKIKDFIKKYKKSGVIYKSLFPVIWVEENNMRLTYTKEISLDDLSSDLMLQSTPGIFQKKINKAFELRVTYFGVQAVAAKLRSQEHEKGRMDWRYAPTHELNVEEFELPIEIDQKCRAFMKSFNIVFGCFDFIVTPDNEYYFLEINEQGQFLWVEEVNPDIKMLDAFTDFLVSGSSDFTWKKAASSISLAEFKLEMERVKLQAIATHTHPGGFF